MKKQMLVFLFLFLFICAAPVRVLAVSASSYCVMDAASGSVLYEKNGYAQKGMASTTKIMTALLALTSGRMDDIAVVSYNATRAIGSSLYLKPGEKLRVYDLVCGLMLNSGNDAAIVLAEHIGGSVENFVKMMNEKAKEIGADQTNFVNPNGLSDDTHYTTAVDLAKITCHALKNEDFRKIVKTRNMKIETIGDAKRSIFLQNHNKLLTSLDGCAGVKTGFTKATGRCLVSAVDRDGMQIICVTLNAPDDWMDHRYLYEQAFGEYQKEIWLENGAFVGNVQIFGGVEKYVDGVVAQTLSGIVLKNAPQDTHIKHNLLENIQAPVVCGQKLGTVAVYRDGQLVAKSDVIACRPVASIPTRTFVERLVKLYLMIC